MARSLQCRLHLGRVLQRRTVLGVLWVPFHKTSWGMRGAGPLLPFAFCRAWGRAADEAHPPFPTLIPVPAL